MIATGKLIDQKFQTTVIKFEQGRQDDFIYPWKQKVKADSWHV